MQPSSDQQHEHHDDNRSRGDRAPAEDQLDRMLRQLGAEILAEPLPDPLQRLLRE